MIADTVPCSKCGGCGKTALPPELQATIDYVRSRPSHLFEASHVARKFGIAHTAACNRLADLHKLGLVTKQYVGHRAFGYGAVGVHESRAAR